jgi:shikimate dehydrogenase
MRSEALAPTVANKQLAVIGDPIAHSLSPLLHRFFIEHFHLPFSYEARRVTPDELPRAFVELKNSGYRGFNVTIPHKQAILPLLDELSETADAIGAANTVIIEDGAAIGGNTDVRGFLSMMQLAAVDLSRREVLVMGAGGAARAVIFALQQGGVSRIFVCNRSPQRLQQCAAWMSATITTKWEAWPWDALEERIKNYQPEIIINATSIGMHPHIEQSPLSAALFSPALTVVDLVYNPLPTRLLREASQAGVRIIHGLNMLIMQGVAAMELWSGKRLDIEAKLPELQKILMENIQR